jgi:hypothetical protein
MRNRIRPLIAFSFVVALAACGTAEVTPSGEPANTGTPSPLPSVDAPIVHGMPGVRGGSAGLYSWWMPGGLRSMHNPDAESIGVSITFQSSAARGSGPTAVTVDGYEGTYEQLPVVDGIRTELWKVDIEDSRVVITVQAQPSSTEAELAEAHAIIESIRIERSETPAGFRLIFTLPDGWVG